MFEDRRTIIIVDFLMGQINCHCQYISTDEYDSIKRKPDSLPVLTTEQNEPTQISTKITLRGTNKIIDIPLSESARVTYGTTDDCQQRQQPTNGSHFKLEVRYRNRCVFLRDCGVGLGAFIMKRKIVRRAGSTEVLLSVLDKWLVLKVLPSKQIPYCVYTAEGASQGLLDQQEEQEIDLGQCKVTIRKDEQGREFSIRCSDRREMWVLMGEERKVRARDVLRLGLEVFEVASVSTYLECSTIIKKY